MRLVLVVTALLLAGATAAAPASAREGAGLYAPFPSPTGTGLAERYLGDFGVVVSRARLRAGTAVARSELTPLGRGAPSLRAGTNVPFPGISLLTGALLAAAFVMGALVGPLRRRT